MMLTFTEEKLYYRNPNKSWFHFCFWSVYSSQVTWLPWCLGDVFFLPPQHTQQSLKSVVHVYTKSSPHSLSDMEIVQKSRVIHDDVIDVIPLSPQNIWQSLKSILQVELEIQSLVLILYLVCKLYLGHVVTIMTSSI